MTRTADHRASVGWRAECLHWRGVVLVGRFAHYCFDFDGLPVDETCEEFDCCRCFEPDCVFTVTPYPEILEPHP